MTNTDGWKLVPVEPTEEMLSAMDDNHTDIGKWRDALAAAPKPQAAQSADMDRLTYRRSLGLPERFPQAVAEDAVVQALPGVHPMERMWREVGLPSGRADVQFDCGVNGLGSMMRLMLSDGRSSAYISLPE